MNHFNILTHRMREQLSENEQQPGNFYAQAQEAKKLISMALSLHNVNAERAAAAAFGGVVKRWRRWLIEQITDAALVGCDTSRDSVRAWQLRIFCQSVASDRLRHYAKPERSGAGRAAQLVVTEAVEQQAAAFYQQYKDAIKSV